MMVVQQAEPGGLGGKTGELVPLSDLSCSKDSARGFAYHGKSAIHGRFAARRPSGPTYGETPLRILRAAQIYQKSPARQSSIPGLLALPTAAIQLSVS